MAFFAQLNRASGLAVANVLLFCFLCLVWINSSYDSNKLSREVQETKGREFGTTVELKRASNKCINDDEKFDLAFDDSLGFFDDIDEANWRLKKRKVNSLSLFKTKSDPTRGIDNLPLWMLNNIDPMFTCPHVMRVGGMGDGGKWTCDPHRLLKRKDCLIYSIGSAGQYAFEDALHKMYNRQCEIHVFDPNPKYARPGDVENKNITYHPWGLSSSYVPSTINHTVLQFRTIPEIVTELGHKGRRIDIFKIDCEGCEWTSYKDWVLKDYVDVRQILIEVHPTIAEKNNVSMATFFSDLYKSGFVPFSKEANTHPGAKPPLTLFEFGFVRLGQNFFKYIEESR